MFVSSLSLLFFIVLLRAWSALSLCLGCVVFVFLLGPVCCFVLFVAFVLLPVRAYWAATLGPVDIPWRDLMNPGS